MRRFNLIVIGVILGGLAALLPLQMWLDRQTGNRVLTEALYLPSGQVVKQLSFGFDGMLSDFYWLRAVQYFGRKVMQGGLKVESEERFDLLYPMLEIATALDPQYIIAYQFGGMFVADYNDSAKAVSLLERGIRANPTEWRLHQYLGLIHWRDKNYEKAAETFRQGGQVPGAPGFMNAMAAQMLAEGGSRATARQLFEQIYNSTDEDNIKSVTLTKLKRLDALDQLDCLQQLVAAYRARAGRYPPGLHLRSLVGALGNEAQNILRQCEGRIEWQTTAQGQAADPDGFAYAYNRETGEVGLAEQTTILKQ